jgi:hypothetical protein
MTSKSIVSFFAIIMFLIVIIHFLAAKIKREADILCPPSKMFHSSMIVLYISSDYSATSTMNLAKEALVTSLYSGL